MRGAATKRRLCISAAISTITAFILLCSTGCNNTQYVYVNGARCVGADGHPIELTNNPNAHNPTFEQLLGFIICDETDTYEYLEESHSPESKRAYTCADFAEDLHNNAEAAGIRAAWVAIELEGKDEGHVCNAFETRDRGLVYIDCTGGVKDAGRITKQVTTDTEPQLSQEKSWDTIAYVEIGKEYGRIHIDHAESTSYGYFEDYIKRIHELETMLDEYNKEIEMYNYEVLSNIYIKGSEEEKRIKAWADELRAKGQELKKLLGGTSLSYYELIGVVEDIHINW